MQRPTPMEHVLTHFSGRATQDLKTGGYRFDGVPIRIQELMLRYTADRKDVRRRAWDDLTTN